MKTVKLDSYKKFTPQNLADELQNAIDEYDVEDVIIIYRDKEKNIGLMLSDITKTEAVGMLEMTKMRIFNY
ncbi:hypothetical protein KYI07_06180 [Macrococcus psychrotolerans]|uniref:Uncharacterized protein n=1 Tax=Macrococcus psychrotolerans TaxID=3039389 RepID=A0AAT9P1J2_9STAP|nr:MULTISPECIES: hypothetical protein [Macrococcus]QYA31987.1 hypothetical protein KYI10_06190 [Macrococcus sp. 19Msa1099]QYA36793.1 hypothetical protein KYI07_06180 [Macrococcus caseolyticus]QYA75501.1 hypothetical protein KYI12_06180 [Macrococcus caseolyticus]